MNTIRFIIFIAALLLACPTFAQDDTSLERLQAKAISAQQRERIEASAQLHFLKSLNAHAMQVLSRAVHSLLKSGVRLKTASQMEAEMEDSPNLSDLTFEYVPTGVSPYIAEEYEEAGGIRTDGGPYFELVGAFEVGMSLPIDPNDMNPSDYSQLVSPSGRPLDSCQITITVGDSVNSEKTSGLSCARFLQGHYDAVIISLIKKAARQAISDKQ